MLSTACPTLFSLSDFSLFFLLDEGTKALNFGAGRAFIRSDYLLLRSLPWLCIPELVVSVQSLDLSDEDSEELQLPRRVVIYSISVQFTAFSSSSLSSQWMRTTTADPLLLNPIDDDIIGSIFFPHQTIIRKRRKKNHLTATNFTKKKKRKEKRLLNEINHNWAWFSASIFNKRRATPSHFQ